MKKFKKLALLTTAMLATCALALASGCENPLYGSGSNSSEAISGSSSVAESSSSVAESSSSVVGSSSSVVESSSVAESSSSVTESSSKDDSSNDSSSNSGDVGEIKTITIAEALELCGESGNITTERYYIRAIVQSITNPQYGSMVIKDETGSISVYGTYSADGSLTYAEMAEKPYKGDEVLLHCILQNYNGTKEVKNARLIEFKSNQGNVDESNYTEMSIAEARGADSGELVKVDGVVAQITYAFGMKPNGVYLVDETQSIYVFDGDLAGRVQEGNTVTILAEKTYWILDSEQNNANKHGYNGCCQLTNVTLVENDGGSAAFNKEWIEESTVKEIVETSVSENITTTIYKVNALVKKVDGTGFTNYYFFDIDGETGAYTYTQCNGSDFAWLDAFDGKICTVYLSAINAKSTATDCFFRFLPIEVIDEDYVFDLLKAAEFAVKYYGVDQFADSYSADPALALKGQVDSELLGFEGAMLSYESDNTSVLYFEEVDGVMVMHTTGEGTANVTVTAKYGENVYSETVVVQVEMPVTYETITVAEAIAAELNSEVIVKGIVGPSLVNQDGFYLFGEDGSMIAVTVKSGEELAGLAIGHEIVLKAIRFRKVKETSSDFGQTVLKDAEVLSNYFGAHEYSTDKLITDKTLADLASLDVTEDYTTSIYRLTLTVVETGNGYYTGVAVNGDGASMTVYCSNSGQYEWLMAFKGQEITVEVAICNWNSKGYKISVLAAYTDEGKLLNTYHFA